MAQGRHSYVRFFPSDWLAGTARMTRTHRSVYFDVCCYQWDQNLPCPASELPLMFGDLPNWRELVEDLVAARKLVRNDDGSLSNAKAAHEAKLAFDLWEKKSKGGKSGAAKTNAVKSDDGTPVETPASTPDGSLTETAGSPVAEPEPEPEPEPYRDDDGVACALTREAEPDPIDLPSLTDRAARAAGVRHVDPGPISRAIELVAEWVAYGATIRDILDTIRDVTATAGEPIRSLRYFDAAIRQAVARRENQSHGTRSNRRGFNDDETCATERAARRVAAELGIADFGTQLEGGTPDLGTGLGRTDAMPRLGGPRRHD